MNTTLRAACFTAAAAIGGFQVLAGAQGTSASQLERTFVKGGRIHMDLSAGEYTIRGSAVDSIRVRWETRDPREMSEVRTDVTVTGTAAAVKTRGPRNNFRVTVDVPTRADLDVNLSAGDLSVRGVEGNKSLSMWAGDVTIEVGDAALYRRVDATVRAGEITATPFGRTTGGLFRSLHWNGSGKYTLNATLTAGDLKLVK